jgi:hypothetical protein
MIFLFSENNNENVFKKHMKHLNIELIWITLINKGYIDFAKNFIINNEKKNIHFPLIIFCTDDESYNELSNYNCITIRMNFRYEVTKGYSDYYNNEYKKIVFNKLDAILYTLKNTYNLNVKSIGYIDTDIILFSDPSVVYSNEMYNHPDINIFAQCDEYSNICTDKLNCPYICSGAIVFRNLPEIYSIFDYSNFNINDYNGGDQDLLLEKIKKNNFKYMTIDKNIVRNGGNYNSHEYKNSKINFDNICLMHFNHCVGDEKKNIMKLNDLWYL